jgi:3-methyladenine DNA glycosylase AlkD
VLAILSKISGSYYVNMAVAWAISMAFVKYENKTLSILKSKSLPTDIQNKSIQKIRDSLRVPKATKDSLIEYKI